MKLYLLITGLSLTFALQASESTENKELNITTTIRLEEKTDNLKEERKSQNSTEIVSQDEPLSDKTTFLENSITEIVVQTEEDKEEEKEEIEEEPYAQFYSIINRPESVPLSNNISWNRYKFHVLKNDDFQGWCTPEKSNKMMDLINRTKSRVCVEIGVFGGKSIYPTACALKYLGAGVVFAIDPWMEDECAKGYTPEDPNCIWWTQKSELEKIYQDFLTKMNQKELSDFCVTMRMTSEKALNFFPDESIDILHIDGNHTEEVSLVDVQMYLPKVKKNGYIWFDDVNWSSTHAALRLLFENCERDTQHSTETCFLFKKLADEE